jgi:hypothetical protein
MSARLRNRVERLERLERRRPGYFAVPWSLLCGEPVDPDDLDPALRELPDGLPQQVEDEVEAELDMGGRLPNGLVAPPADGEADGRQGGQGRLERAAP